MLIWHKYTLWRECIHHLAYLFIFKFLLRTLEIYSHSKFQWYNTDFSVIITMWYIGSSDLGHLITESLYAFIRGLWFEELPFAWLRISERHCGLQLFCPILSLANPSPPQVSGSFLPPPTSSSYFCAGTPWTKAHAHWILPSQSICMHVSSARQKHGAWRLSHSLFSWQTT